MRAVAILGIALSLGGMQPFFKSAQASDIDPILSEIVVTGERQDASLRELAGNTSQLDSEEIDFVRYTHINEALARVPGVFIHRGSGQEHLTAIRSPVLTGGAGAGSFLYLEDGIPLRAAGFANVNGLFEAHGDVAERIEVVRGPGSALYGSNAVHGLINFITPEPVEGRLASVDLAGGSFGRYRLKTRLSQSIGKFGYFAGFSADKENGFRDETGFDQQKLTFRSDYKTGKTHLIALLHAQNLNQETGAFIRGADAFENRSLAKTNPNPEAFRDARSVRAAMRIERDLGSDDKLVVTPYVRWNDMDFLLHFLPSRALEESGHQSAGVQSTYYRNFEGGHEALVGVDVEVTDGFLKEIQSLPSFGSFPQGVHYDYEVVSTVVAPYIQLEYQVSTWLRASAGLRYEYTKYDYENLTDSNTVGRFQRPSDREDDFSNFLPKFGLVADVNENTVGYVNYSRGARAPQTSDLYRLQSRQSVGDIKSERLDSIEVGLRGSLWGAQYQVSGFYMKKRNFFFRDTDGFNVANGRTKHRGVEVELEVPLTDTLFLAGAATYARHTYDFDNTVSVNSTESIVRGDEVDTAPRLLSNARLGWAVSDELFAEFEWIRVGRYYTDASNQHDYDGHNLFNVRMDWAFCENAKAYAVITNLANSTYAERADFSFGTDRYFPGETRAFQLGVQAAL